MSTVKEVAVFAANQLGQMATLTRVLSEAGINIRWVTIATTETFGVFRFLVDQSEAAYQCLKQRGFTVSLIEVLALEVCDKPGGLYEVASVLTRNQVNVENASGFVVQPQKRAVLLIEVRDTATARRVLAEAGLHLLTDEEIFAL